MKALTVIPGIAGSVGVRDVPEPAEPGPVLVRGLEVGVCGTDREIVAGEYGVAPPGEEYLVLGHESLGRVTADASGTFAPGDLVVGIVRHPDPQPCANCAVGEWDMCRNGDYTEHGIKGLPGFARQRYRLDPAFAVRLDPDLESIGVLLEPASVVAKAWEHLERIGARALFEPRTVLVTGAGPVGLLAALLGVLRGLEVHVMDRHTTGPKPQLVADLGATHHGPSMDTVPEEVDVVLECTAAPTVVFDSIYRLGPGGVGALTGVSSMGRTLEIDAGGINRELVLENNAVFGSVNANRRHYEQAADALAKADRSWLERLITRRVPLDRADEALHTEKDDVKVVIEIGEAAT